MYQPLAKCKAMDLVFYKTRKNPNKFNIKVTDKHLVNDMYVYYITTQDVPLKKQPYDGEIVFKYHKQSVLKAHFSLHPNCHYVHFTLHGKTYTRKLSPAGIAYLETVRAVKLVIQH
ncbi:hypothetical protein M23134_04059 [Microscilla marina ATCC 23134]|uniref:Uncharacterized protein n=2 Tax=Microscilla marina TaxID=1027 RepID=A1ZDR8_MICM2|nr:hypothetical protein M23134_04059 [Microscilla marina ATCC 23134]